MLSALFRESNKSEDNVWLTHCKGRGGQKYPDKQFRDQDWASFGPSKMCFIALKTLYKDFVLGERKEKKIQVALHQR